MNLSQNSALHKVLLLGTKRTPIKAEMLHPPELSALFMREQTDSSLWHAIAADDLWRRAAFQATNVLAQSGAEPDEHLCPPAIGQVLKLILGGAHPELLDIWLLQAQTQKFRLPHSHLPALLDRGLQNAKLRALLMPLLDKRGHWLIEQNPLWAKSYGIAGDDTANQWTYGNLSERVQALRAMRSTNPASALLAMQNEWANESAENRAALLACLEVALSLQDEVFLEQALDDKRKEVRTIAQQLLMSLPESKLVQRCKMRLETLLIYKKKLLLGVALTVSLPELCDKSMHRDGIGLQSQPGLGEKAVYLRDLVRSVPPQFWSESWNLSALEVIKLMAAQEFNVALLNGLVQASINAVTYVPGDIAYDWYRELLSSMVIGNLKVEVPQNLMAAFTYLPAAQQHAVVQRWLADSDADWNAQNHIIDWCRQAADAATSPWPAELSVSILSRVQTALLKHPDNNWRLRSILNSLAKVLDVSEQTDYETNWPSADWPLWTSWRQTIDDLLDTLRFRRSLQRSFLESNE